MHCPSTVLALPWFSLSTNLPLPHSYRVLLYSWYFRVLRTPHRTAPHRSKAQPTRLAITDPTLQVRMAVAEGYTDPIEGKSSAPLAGTDVGANLCHPKKTDLFSFSNRSLPALRPWLLSYIPCRTELNEASGGAAAFR